MHVQSNRTRVHLYCTHSISDSEPHKQPRDQLGMFVGKPAQVYIITNGIITQLEATYISYVASPGVWPVNVYNEHCSAPGEKSEDDIKKEISAVIRQITASVTFDPLLESACKY